MGLVQPSAGIIELLAAGVSRQRARAHVGFLSELFTPYTMLTVAEHLQLYDRLIGMAAALLQQHRQEVVQRLKLTEVVLRQATVLSKGTVQRLGLAQSLLHAPELVV